MTPNKIAIILSALFLATLGIIMFRNQIGTFFASAGNAPVAYWKFDEGTGSTTQDSIGSNEGVFGVGNSAPTWAAGEMCISEKCISFDGTGDYINLPASSTVQSETQVTFTGWVKATSFNATNQIYFESTSTSNTTRFGVYLNSSGNVLLAIRDSAADPAGTVLIITSASGISLNTWTHIAAVFDSVNDSHKIYINGNLDKTDTTAKAALGSSTAVQIRIGNALNEPFKGFIDEVKIYDYARTADQIKADYAARGTTRGVSARFGDDDLSRKLSDGLVGYWKMDEAIGSTGPSWTAIDSSGNGYNGSGVGNAGSTSPGVFGNAGKFDGTNDGITAPDMGTFSVYTATAWIKTANVSSGTHSNIFYWPSTASFIQIDDGVCFYTGTWSCTTTTPPANTWFHIAVTSEGKAYINGVYDGTIIVGTFSGSVQIAERNDTTYDLDGYLDEVRIYNRALAPDEVKDLYEFAPGPIGYYKFDEGTGISTVQDSSGNGHTGTMSSMVESDWIQGKFGKALNFNGSIKYIDLYSSSFNSFFNGSQGTVSTWMKIPSASIWGDSAINYLFKFEVDGSNGVYCYKPATNNDIQCLYKAGGTTELFDYATTTTEWLYVTVSWDKTADTVKWYVDGILRETDTSLGSWSGNLASTTTVIASNSTSSSSGWSGYIDDFKIYNYARTSSQIAEDMNAGHPAVGTPVGSTVLHLKMDEGYGTTVQDWSPQENDAALTGGTATPSWTLDGKFGKALSFDGSSDYLYVADTTSLRFDAATDDFSVFAWVKRSVSGATHYVLSKEDADNDGWRLQINSTDTVTCSTGVTDITSAATITDTNWHQVGCVIDRGGNGQVYIDALPSGGAVGVGSTAMATTAALNIGSRSYTRTSFFNGSIDEVKVYPLALTADQVKLDFNQGKAQVMGAGSTGVGSSGASFSAAREYCVPGDSSTCSAPVGEWKFDEGTGTSANDTSGNGNTGTLTNGPMWTSGKYGSSVNFDGTDDYVTVSDNNVLDVTTAWSMAAWIKRSGTTNGTNDDIIAKGTSSGSYTMYFDTSNRLSFVVQSVAIIGNSGTAITDTNWHYVMVTRDSNNLYSFYIDGVLANSITSTNAPTANTNVLTFGGPANPLGGQIDDVRIYDYARTPAQIAWEYNRGAPIAWWKFDECTGTTANDWGPNANGGFNGNTGTIVIGSGGSEDTVGDCDTASTAWGNGATGKRGASLDFDGTDDYVNVGDQSSLDFVAGRDFSITAWINRSTFNTIDVIVAKHNNAASLSGDGYILYIHSNDTARLIVGNGSVQLCNVLSDHTITTSGWNFIAGVYDDTGSSTCKIYINSVVKSNNQNSGGDPDNALSFKIGAESDGGNPFDGQIDDVRVFNYALTPAQVKEVMNYGAVRFE